MTSNTTPSPFVASASSAYSGYDAYRAFNRTNGNQNGWSSAVNDVTNSWLQINIGTPRIITKYSIQTVGGNWESPYYYFFPKTWQLLGSNDGTNFDVLDNIDAKNLTLSNYTKYTYILNTKPLTKYKIFRLKFNGTRNTSPDTTANVIEIGEWYIYGH
jgi:hypothetical protein